MHALATKVQSGDVRAVAQACRLVDERAPNHRELLKALYSHSQRSFWIGITGAPGVGKSTLTGELIAAFRREGLRVGVVAVDPSSPFSGGAILGDRVRMQAHFEDDEVFIRSLATRGAQGGLSRSAVDVARVLSAWGADVVLLETVGVGQDELEVAFAADAVVVVVAPGLGDEMQALKAGLFECASIFVVNKADLAGADSAVRHLEQRLALGALSPGPALSGHVGGHLVAKPSKPVAETELEAAWGIPILRCRATEGVGINELWAEIARYRAWLSGTEKGKAHALSRALKMLVHQLRDELVEVLLLDHKAKLEELAYQIQTGVIDPYRASEALRGALKAT